MKLPKIKTRTTPSLVRDLHSQMLQETTRVATGYIIGKMRGNVRSKILLIAPPCNGDEYQMNIPFANNSAKEFHLILNDHGLDTEKHFLVVSCSAFGEKPSKQSTELVKAFIEKCAKFNIFDMYMCVGDDAFKFIFGAGKKPSSAALYGSTIFVPETGYKPLFTFPSPDMLTVPENAPEWQLRRLNAMSITFAKKYHKYARMFKAALQKHGIKI